MTVPTTDDTLARLAVRVPAATRVFARYDLDYCCGGRRRLSDVCAERGLEPGAILEEISREERPDGNVTWDERPLEDLIAHIVLKYHRPLDEDMPRLLNMSRKVLAAHGERDPERLSALVDVLENLFSELSDHMKKEEQVLFPWIASGDGRTAGAPISVMLDEHESAARALTHIRELTNEFTAPAGACVTWRALWLGLQTFDQELREHVHLENNVLFPRALAS